MFFITPSSPHPPAGPEDRHIALRRISKAISSLPRHQLRRSGLLLLLNMVRISAANSWRSRPNACTCRRLHGIPEAPWGMTGPQPGTQHTGGHVGLVAEAGAFHDALLEVHRLLPKNAARPAQVYKQLLRQLQPARPPEASPPQVQARERKWLRRRVRLRVAGTLTPTPLCPAAAANTRFRSTATTSKTDHGNEARAWLITTPPTPCTPPQTPSHVHSRS